MRKMRRAAAGRTAWQRAEGAFGADGEFFARIPVFVMRGNREMEVFGCEGILEYGAEKVSLALCRGSCTVCGGGLTLEDFSDGTLVVRGVIGCVSFDGEE